MAAEGPMRRQRSAGCFAPRRGRDDWLIMSDVTQNKSSAVSNFAAPANKENKMRTVVVAHTQTHTQILAGCLHQSASIFLSVTLGIVRFYQRQTHSHTHRLTHTLIKPL